VAPVDRVLEEDDGPSAASYLASTLSASLELVKEGVLEARQLEHFQDIYLRTRAEPLEVAE
jgi:segregation and condensation protein A